VEIEFAGKLFRGSTTDRRSFQHPPARWDRMGRRRMTPREMSMSSISIRYRDDARCDARHGWRPAGIGALAGGARAGAGFVPDRGGAGAGRQAPAASRSSEERAVCRGRRACGNRSAAETIRFISINYAGALEEAKNSKPRPRGGSGRAACNIRSLSPRWASSFNSITVTPRPRTPTSKSWSSRKAFSGPTIPSSFPEFSGVSV
jgi:hypothetical protein